MNTKHILWPWQVNGSHIYTTNPVKYTVEVVNGLEHSITCGLDENWIHEPVKLDASQFPGTTAKAKG